MKNFIKWLVPWDNEMKMLLKVLGFFVILFIFFILTGCSTLQDKMDEQQQQLKCSPPNSINCSGWEV